MSLLTKILIFLGAIIVILGLGFIIYKQNEISNRQQAIETQIVQQKELAGNIMRSQNGYATKDDIEKFIKDSGVNLRAIQDDLNKLHASISAANTIVVTSSGQVMGNLSSSSTGAVNPTPTSIDTYGYLKNAQILNLHEDFSGTPVPIGQVGFSAWQPSPWNINVLPRQYKVTNVIGTDDNQRTYVYNKFVVTVDNKDYEVKIAKAETKQEYPTAKWSWWNPRLFIGADGGINANKVKGEFAPSINLGIMSYGQYKTSPDFSVLQVGVGIGVVSQKPQFILTPGAYNIGKHIPLMNNTYIAPSLQVGIDGSISIMAGLRVGL
jgi:hypothetical protein